MRKRARALRRNARAHSAIIIDHGIRPEAAHEAARVGRRMQEAGIAVTVHKVVAVAPATGVQEWARAQRYAIATDIARRSGAALLLGPWAAPAWPLKAIGRPGGPAGSPGTPWGPLELRGALRWASGASL